MQDVVYYTTATGEITGTKVFEDADTVADITDQMDVSESYMFGVADYNLDYVTFPAGVPTITPRPTITGVDFGQTELVADGVATLDFALPAGTTVTYNNVATVSVAGEHFQVKSTQVGIYLFDIDPPFPYLGIHPLTVIINAV
jgi:hypothetical protein